MDAQTLAVRTIEIVVRIYPLRKKRCVAFLFGITLAITATAQVSLSPTTKQVPAGRTVYELLVDAGTEWTANADVAWAALSPNPGRGQLVVTVSVAENLTGQTREATITVGGATHRLTQLADDDVGFNLAVAGSNENGQLGVLNHPHTRFGSWASDVVAVAAGTSHSLYLKNDRTLWAVGDNSDGQIGDGTRISRFSPVQISSDVSAIAASGRNSFFIKTDGTLWGSGNIVFQLSPVLVASGVRNVAVGHAHLLFVKTDGSLWTMGSNEAGQLGDGTTVGRGAPTHIANDVQWVAANARHSLFVKADGTLWGMGRNSLGALGDGTTTNRSTPVQISSAVTSAVAGEWHSLFVKTDGTLWATGFNSSGKLGIGSSSNRLVPTQVTVGVAKVAAGDSHSLFVKTDGTLWAMGGNSAGQLGRGSLAGTVNPVQVGSGVDAVVAGGLSSFVIKADGTLWATGSNYYGQLGNGIPAVGRPAFTSVTTGIKGVAVGESYSLVVKSDGTLWGMGLNNSGQLGDGTTVNRGSLVQTASEVAGVAAGKQHTLVLRQDGSLWTTGLNNFGQLGDGLTTNRAIPVNVAAEVAAYAAGTFHSLFVKTDGSLWAMGLNSSGQLGDGTTVNRSSPVQVASAVSAVAGGETASYFIKKDGTLWGMGARLGGSSLSPVQLASEVSMIAAHSGHCLFVKSDGSLWGMGDNFYMQLGDGTSSNRATPVQIASGVSSVATGPGHSIFVKIDGTVWVMGSNGSGQLGSGTVLNRATPTHVASGVASVAAGGSHTLIQAGSVANFIGRPRVQPAIDWDSSSIVYGTPLGVGQLNARVRPDQLFSYSPTIGAVPGSALPVNFTMPGAFSYSVQSETVLPVGDHVVSMVFTPQDSVFYEPVTLTRTITVHKAPQTISLQSWSSIPFTAEVLSLNAVASSGLPIALTVEGAAALTNGDDLRITGPGTVTVIATQQGNENYHPASPVEFTFQVTPNRLSWLHEQFDAEARSDADVSGWFADPDRDGSSNLVEYARGTNPYTPDTSPALEIRAEGDSWLVSFLRPAERADIAYFLDISQDLVTWAPIEFDLVSTDAPNEIRGESRVPRTGFETLFGRLRVEAN